MAAIPDLARTSGAPEFIVLKFGGTSVSTKPRWANIAALAKARRDEGARVVIVVSALSGVTDALKAICDRAARGEDVADAAAALAKRHREFVAELGLLEAPELAVALDRLDALCSRGLSPDGAPRVGAEAPPAGSTRRGSLEWQAEVLALGELMSSSLGVRVLRAHGLDAGWIDARDYLCAEELPNQTDWSKRLSASCTPTPDAKVQAALAAKPPVLITQGFIARARDGGTAILGRGGSDTSASYFGALLKAKRVEIWTDVAGMFSANPRQVRGTRLLQRLDYEEAQEIATTGAKVLHPRCLSPVREAKVPLYVKDTNRPELPGTEVGAVAASEAPSVKAISYRPGITLVSMESIGMWQQVGFLADVFAEFKRHGLSIDLIGSAETNVTVSLDPTQNLVDSDVLEALCADLARVCRVKVIAPCASITMVGRGIRSLLHRLAPVLAEFGREHVHLISQSSNNLNLTFVVDEAVAADMIPKLHALLIKTGAMRVEDDAVFGPSWEQLYGRADPATSAPAWWQGKRDALLALARERSPRYVYDLDTVRGQAGKLKRIGAVDGWFYAMKANWNPAILRTLTDAGFAIECVSQAEIAAVRTAVPGLSHERILFTPNFAPRAEYEQAFADGVWVTIDSLHPLEHWPDVVRNRQVILRLDLGHGSGHHDKVVTGGAGSKFGLPLEQLEAFRARARALGVQVVGVHAHLGSGILDVAHFRERYGQLASLAESFPECIAINVGGGLGVPSRPDEVPLDLEALAGALAEVKSVYPQYKVWMEPGRFLVADAGVLLARVTQVKHKTGYTYVGLDTGMNSLIRPALYDAYHPMANLSRLDEPADTVCQIVGPICESGDILGRNRKLPSPREGDVIVIGQAGAYGAVMASRYNLREPAEEVAL